MIDATVHGEIKNCRAEVVNSVQLPASVFAYPIRVDLMKRVVCWQESKSRAGTHKVQTISDRSGSTRKIYKQKGRGAARHCTNKVNLFRGGAPTFGPVVRLHDYKMNKRDRKYAFYSAISYKMQNNQLHFVGDFTIPSCKSADLLKILFALGVKGNKKNNIPSLRKVLCIDAPGDYCEGGVSTVAMAASNLQDVSYLSVNGLNVRDILLSDNVIISEVALRAIIHKYCKV